MKLNVALLLLAVLAQVAAGAVFFAKPDAKAKEPCMSTKEKAKEHDKNYKKYDMDNLQSKETYEKDYVKDTNPPPQKPCETEKKPKKSGAVLQTFGLGFVAALIVGVTQ